MTCTLKELINDGATKRILRFYEHWAHDKRPPRQEKGKNKKRKKKTNKQNSIDGQLTLHIFTIFLRYLNNNKLQT